MDKDGKVADVDSSLGRITWADKHCDVAVKVRMNVVVSGVVKGDWASSGAEVENVLLDTIVIDDKDANVEADSISAVSMSDVDGCAISVTGDTVEFVSITVVDGGAIVLDIACLKSETGDSHGTWNVLSSGKERHEYSEGHRSHSKGKMEKEVVDTFVDGLDVDSVVSRITLTDVP